MEILESRTLFSLVGAAPGVPVITAVGGAAGLQYSASAHTFDITAVPSAVLFPAGFGAVDGGSVGIHILVDNTGHVIPPGTNSDLVITGTLTDPSINGTFTSPLVTGKITAFGYQDDSDPASQFATFDFKFQVTGGSMANSYFSGSEVDVVVNAENILSFNGTFTSNFSGLPKVTAGPKPGTGTPPVAVGDFVWNDVNHNGIQDAGEPGINGVSLTLTGTNYLGQAVTDHRVTAGNGTYLFLEAPGTYTVTVDSVNTALAGYSATLVNAPGSTTANDSNPKPTGTTPGFLPGGSADLTLDFGYYANNPLATGDTATIGFWHNKNGQALINSLNGGSTSTSLGNWLSTNFTNLYGVNSGGNNLAGKTNAQIASYFTTLFNAGGQKVYAQVLANAFAIYTTSSALSGGTYADPYGFNVDPSGTGAATYNIGSNGAALGVANGSVLSVFQILKLIDSHTVNGVLENGNQTLINMVNTIADGINTGGDIS